MEEMATLNVKEFPQALYKRLQKHAERARRSLSQHVIHLLAEAVKRPSRHSILELRGLGKELWSELDAAEYVDSERNSWR